MGDPRVDPLLLERDDLLHMIRAAVRDRRPFALARLGTAEMAVLGHAVAPSAWPMQRYVAYSGIARFDRRTPARLASALQSADVLGLLPQDSPHAVSTRELLDAFAIHPQRACSAWVTHQLSADPAFLSFLAEVRLVVAGRRAAEALPSLDRLGIRPVAAYDLEGLDAVEVTLNAIQGGPPFDLALISAGVPAAIAAVELRDRMGAVTLDFGHALDLIIDGDAFNYRRLEEAWWQNQVRRRRRSRRGLPARRRACRRGGSRRG